VLLSACVTTAPMQQPAPRFEAVEIELTVKDVDADLVAQLQAAFAKVTELRAAQLKSHNGKTAVFTIMYPGDVSDLPKTLATLPSPGLKFLSARHQYEYGAFDNQPPTIAFVHPQPEQVLNLKEQFIAVEVPDKDLASVTINGKTAPLYKGTIYRLKVELNEGKQELVATAKDKAGNESNARVSVTVDTTAPALQAQLKLIVEGHVEAGSSVLIDGVEVSVDSGGNYRAEVPVRKGQKKVEIVAIDQSGNKSVTVKTLGE
jgi:Glucodextranase, domain B